jgi:oligoendopeptidase F
MADTTTAPTTWDFSQFFSSDTDPTIQTHKAEIQKHTTAFAQKWQSRKDYLEDPKVLRQALDEYEAWSRDYGWGGNLTLYFFLRFQQEQSNPEVKAKYLQTEEFLQQQSNEVRFFELNIAKVSPDVQKIFLQSKELEPYHHLLERLFAESQYLLEEREEMIMTMKSTTAYSNWVDMLEGLLVREERTVLDEDGTKQTKDFSTLLTMMNSQQKKVRDSAAAAFNDILAKYEDIAEAEINAVITDKKINDQIRKVPRPDITRHISDDMDTAVVDMLIETVAKRFDIPQRFYKLKAKLLGLPKLAYHERNVEYGSVDNKKYSWDESVALVGNVLEQLDPAFYKIFKRFLDEGRFDVFPRKGKCSGAFCFHHLISQPTYILLNHTGTLRDVLTLAHEVGHGINNELIKEKQHALYFGTPTSTAEVASTFFEDFVTEELMKTADSDTKIALAMMKLNEEVSTIFRQIACYRFEQALHQQIREKGYLSKQAIGQLFTEHMAAYMGDAVEQSSGSENWWIYWGHIRKYFYVYSYASGLLISKNLQEQVRADARNIEMVKTFLATGYARSPKDTFAEMGIDVATESFWKQSLVAIENDLQMLEKAVVKG